jgi:hypothetical protein
MAFRQTARMNLTLAVGLLLAGTASLPARADLTIVTEVNTSRSGGPAGAETAAPSPQTVTTYYKGDKARVEAADGTVTLYDRAAEKVYTLHPAEKTFSALPLKQMLERGADLASQMPTNARRMSANVKLKVETKVALKQDKAAAKQAFIDQEASRYNLTGSATLKPESGGGFAGGGFPGGGRRGGGRRGGGFPGGGFPGGDLPGGGFPGGGRRPGGGYPGGGGGPGGEGRRMPSIAIAGEYWIGAAPSIKTKVKNLLLPSIVQTVPPGPFVRPLDDKVAKTKGFPLSSKVTVTLKSPRTETSTTVTVTTAVKSMKEDPLADALFQVPPDYKGVDPPPGSKA